MSKKKKDFYADHARPITRRDFLSRWGSGLSATMLAPTLLTSLLSARASLAGNRPVTAGSVIPFLVIDCVGGAGLPGNFLVGGAGGPQDLLPSYSLLGWNPRESGALDTRFGLPMSALRSQIFNGIVQNSPPDAQARYRMGSFLHFAQDDSSTNYLSAAILALEKGAAGSVISRGFGTVAALSGGNSLAINQTAALQPVFVNSISDVINALSFGPTLNLLPAAYKRSLIATALDMSVDQLSGISGMPADFKNQLLDAHQSVDGYITAGALLDPRNDPDMVQIYGLNSNMQPNDPNLVAASLTMNVLKGNVGPSVLSVPNCDYHDGSQTTGDSVDGFIGLLIGRAIASAHALKKPLFIQVITDGGVYSLEGTRNWASDAGDKCMSVIGFYDPLNVPELIRPNRPQIGAYNVGQGVDMNTLIGSDPAKAGYAAFANYLHLSGKLDENRPLFDTVFGGGSVDQVLLFAPRSSS